MGNYASPSTISHLPVMVSCMQWKMIGGIFFYLICFMSYSARKVPLGSGRITYLITLNEQIVFTLLRLNNKVVSFHTFYKCNVNCTDNNVKQPSV